MAVSSVDAKGTPEAQLRSLIEKLDPKDQKLIRAVRAVFDRGGCSRAREGDA